MGGGVSVGAGVSVGGTGVSVGGTEVGVLVGPPLIIVGDGVGLRMGVEVGVGGHTQSCSVLHWELRQRHPAIISTKVHA